MYKVKWYLSTWFICIWFFLSFLYVPVIVGVILLILRINEDKKIQKYWNESRFGEIVDSNKEKERIEKEMHSLLNDAQKELDKFNKKIESKEKEIEDLNNRRNELQSEVIVLDDEVLYQSFGFYEPKYDLENSEEYKEKLKEIRNQQKVMVKNKTATHHFDNWQLDGSKQKGRVMNNNNIKLTIRSFNNECDAAVRNVKFNNINSMEKRIKKAYDQLNKTNKNNRIEIRQEYLAIKLDELYLAYEYAQKREEEKEEQRQIREQIREEKKLQQEIERQRKKIEKDEKHHELALNKYQEQLLNANDEEKQLIEEKIREVTQKMDELKKEREQVDYREQNARAGYVYIISNIGSFGENVYKIGMTRRLEPNDRVKELGDASVPFTYDIHAMIFSNDAPSLESELHREFTHKRVNLVNMRKEFFNVTLNEIEKIVKSKHDKIVEFTKLAEAEEWRKSNQLKEREKEVTA